MKDCLQRCGRRWRRSEAGSGEGPVDMYVSAPTFYSKGDRSSRKKARLVSFVQLKQDPGTGLSGGETGGGRFGV